jgi:phage tail-like protein
MNSVTETQKYLLLDQLAGWNVGSSKGLSLAYGGYFTLIPLPGPAEPLFDANHEKATFFNPGAVAMIPGGTCNDGNKMLILDIEAQDVKQIDLGNVLVVDPETGEISRSSNAMHAVKTVPSIGGVGSEARNLRDPRGIAVLPSGAIAIADTGNHRIQVFSPALYALLQVWGKADNLNRPVVGPGPKQFSSPWDVASDEKGNVYVADRGNRQVQKISQDGVWLADIGEKELVDPTRVTVGPTGLIAVIDGGETPALLMFAADGRRLGRWTRFHDPSGDKEIPLIEPRSLVFDSSGRLYMGNGKGLIYTLAPRWSTKNNSGVKELLGYSYVGMGDTHLVGDIVDLAWHSTFGLVAIIHQEENEPIEYQRRLWRVDPSGAFLQEGTLITEALDSRTEKCQWHRILLSATLPKQTDHSNRQETAAGQTRLGGSSLKIETFTADELLQDNKGEGDPKIVPGDSAAWKTCVLSGDNNPDCLVQSGPGRYLWLRLTFRSNGRASPELRSVKAFFPRTSYLQYLPAVYQEDEESRLFLDRFLSIFQTEFDDLDGRIDKLWQLFDPFAIPEKHLDWLSGWLALFISPNWKADKQRRMLKNAFGSYGRRGTVDGLEQAIVDYADVSFAQILEHFRIRRWPLLSNSAPLDGSAKLWSRDFYQRLQLSSYSQIGYFQLTGHPEPIIEPLDWGAHQFTVFFPADPYCAHETTERVTRVVEREKPAHTSAVICPVLPRFRVGVQATIGVDSVVGAVSHLVLSQNSTLNYDSILSCSADERQFTNLGTSIRPRAGVTTILA